MGNSSKKAKPTTEEPKPCIRCSTRTTSWYSYRSEGKDIIFYQCDRCHHYTMTLSQEDEQARTASGRFSPDSQAI